MPDKTDAEILNSCSFGELEETTRTPSYYTDEDYPERPKIQKPLHERSNHCGSESSTQLMSTFGTMHSSGACHKRRSHIFSFLIIW